MDHTLKISEEVYDLVRQAARDRNVTPDQLAMELLTAYLSNISDDKHQAFYREVAAFEKLEPSLREQYSGRFVAIYQGQVVGDSDNRLDLFRELVARLGEIVCYIEKVGEPLRRVRSTSMWRAS